MARTDTTIAGCGLILVLFPFMLVANAMAISYGWNELISVSFGVQTINAYQAYGLSCVVSYLTAGDITAKTNTAIENKGKDIAERMFSLLILGFGRPLFFVIAVSILLSIAGPENMAQ